MTYLQSDTNGMFALQLFHTRLKILKELIAKQARYTICRSQFIKLIYKVQRFQWLTFTSEH